MQCQTGARFFRTCRLCCEKCYLVAEIAVASVPFGIRACNEERQECVRADAEIIPMMTGCIGYMCRSFGGQKYSRHNPRGKHFPWQKFEIPQSRYKIANKY